MLFVGISLLVSVLGIIPDPSEEQTVLYILTRHIDRRRPYLVFVQVSTALILTLAANTSFADFPRLSSFLARDGFMPRQFGFRGIGWPSRPGSSRWRDWPSSCSSASAHPSAR